MKPFNLEEYLKNPSRKIVTRDGRVVERILCTDAVGHYPIVALVKIYDGTSDKDCVLEERYFGYEFCIYRPETPDEIVRRLCLIVESRCDDLLRKEEEIARIDKEILKLKNRKRDILTITNCEE